MAGARIQLKRATASSWASNNPVLFAGEIGLETDTNKFKIGDGTTAFNSLSYFNGNLAGSSLNDLADVTIVSAANGDFLRWNGSAWVNDAVNLSTDTVGSYVESLVAGTGVTLTNNSGEAATPTVAIGQDVSTSASVQFAQINTTGNVVVGGDFTVNGTTTTINTETVNIADNLIVLNSNETSSPSQNAGIEIERGSATNVSLRWNETTDKWEFTTDGTNYDNIATETYAASLTPTSLDDIGDVTLTSASAGDFLKWDGTAWINDPINLGTDTVGNYVSDVVAGTGINISHSPGEGSSASVILNAGLNDLSDVTLSGSPEQFQTLKYEGAGWVNSYAPVVSYVRNVEATTLTVGTVVYLFGGTGDHASVKRADNSSDTTSSKTVGIVGTAISASENGPVITRGYASGMNLESYSVGDVLWLGSNGQFTTTKPSAPNHLVFIGVVVRATSNGIIYVATQNGYEIEELHDVKISSPANGDYLRYNSASALWVNDQINLGTDTVGDYVQNLVAGTGVTLSNNSGEGSTPTVAIGQNVATSASVTFAHVDVQGDLHVQGTITRLNETNLDIEEAFVYLNASSASANPDMGIAFNYNDGSYKHAGFFRDSSDGLFKIFDSYTPEPQTPIDTAHGSYNDASLQVKTISLTQTTGTAPLSVSSSTVVTNLNADKLDGQDGSYYAPINNPTFTGTVTLPNNTVALGSQTTGNYMVDLSGGTGLVIAHTPAEGSTATISLNATLDDLSNVTAPSPSDGQFLKYVSASSAWVPAAIPTINALDDIGNVNAPSPSDGEFLKYDSASSAWVPAAIPTINAINDIGDVEVGGAQINDLLAKGEAGWVAQSPSSIAANINLNDIGDVNAAPEGVGEVLIYGDGAWTNEAATTFASRFNLDDINNVEINFQTQASGDILQYNGQTWQNVAFPANDRDVLVRFYMEVI